MHIQGIGANWAVPVVAKTYFCDKGNSQSLLRQVLEQIKKPNFHIQFVYQLVENIDTIVACDPQFASIIYQKIFQHQEKSNEKTHMGGIVMPMTSTRRQDYEMCYWLLIRKYNNFLASSPLSAIETMITVLNRIILNSREEFKIRKAAKKESFKFRGKEIQFISDDSYIWDERDNEDKPIRMATVFFNYLGEQCNKPNNEKLIGDVLDIFRDNVKVTFFWKRLLIVAANHPEVFHKFLFELCIARPIQKDPDTMVELVQFLEATAALYTPDQRLKIEKSILALTKHVKGEKANSYLIECRNRLLTRIPENLLQTQKARQVRAELKKTGKTISLSLIHI